MSTTYTVDSEIKIGSESLASGSEAISSSDASVRRVTLDAGEELEFQAGSVATLIQVDISAGNKIQLTMNSTVYDLYGFMRLPNVGALKITNSLTASVDIVVVTIS